MGAEGSCYIFETHLIQEELCGNGSGLIIKSDDTVNISEWIMKRLRVTNVSEKCTPS